jgi:hypothetical protein
MLVVYTVEVVYATLEVLDAAALELVLVTTPLALEVLDVDAAAEEELEELLEVVVVVAAAVDEAV